MPVTSNSSLQIECVEQTSCHFNSIAVFKFVYFLPVVFFFFLQPSLSLLLCLLKQDLTLDTANKLLGVNTLWKLRTWGASCACVLPREGVRSSRQALNGGP